MTEPAVVDRYTPVQKVTPDGRVTLQRTAVEHAGLDDADYVAVVSNGHGAQLAPVDADDVTQVASRNVLRDEAAATDGGTTAFPLGDHRVEAPGSVPGPNPAKTCDCGRPAEGYDAQLGRRICESCARLVASVREPTETVARESRTLQAGPDVEEIVGELREKREKNRRLQMEHWKADAGVPAAWHAGRADGFRDAISLLTGDAGGSGDV